MIQSTALAISIDQPFYRNPANPILTADNWPYPANAVLNPGATLLADGTTLLLCRVEDMRGHSHLTIARSKNGIDGWEIDPAPALAPMLPEHPEELWGIEDPRITYLPELDRYAIAFTAFSEAGPCVAMAVTKDFAHFERLGVVMSPEDKDAALFPRRFGCEWSLIHRPVSHAPGQTSADMWISRSNDLKRWGDSVRLLSARHGAWWDARKIGLAGPPIETPRGWIIMYHGVRFTADGGIYRVGIALVDIDDPTKTLLRSDRWIFGPRADYERTGDVGNVVFPCGFTLQDDKDTLHIYYGAADTSVALATTTISCLLEHLDAYGQEPTGLEQKTIDKGQ